MPMRELNVQLMKRAKLIFLKTIDGHGMQCFLHKKRVPDLYGTLHGNSSTWNRKRSKNSSLELFSNTKSGSFFAKMPVACLK
eukprot:12398915-Karenia_brevis.AAC.1